MISAIAVFAKAPIPGRVKTRLAVAVGSAEAARLYESMVAGLLRRLMAACEELACDIELHTDTSSDAWAGFAVTRKLQPEGDMGVRLFHSLHAALAAGRPRVMIVGGDVPTVPVSHLMELLAMEEDVALGPAEDGGYWAISCRRVHPSMFAGVAWSTSLACEQTAAACRAAGLTVGLGPVWFDIDEPSDLERI